MLDLASFGEVFEATYIPTNEKRIAKRIKKTMVEDINLFKKEFLLIQQLDHPNISKVYELFEDNGDEYIYITSQLLRGCDMMEKIYGHNFYSEEDVKSQIMPLAETISFLHSAGIIHRRVLPTNIIFDIGTGKEVLMLINFALAEYAKNNKEFSQLDESPLFIAPEVYKTVKCGFKSDV